MTTESCQEFQANKWKLDLCTNCQRHEADHRSQKTVDSLKKTGLPRPIANPTKSQLSNISEAVDKSTKTAGPAAKIGKTLDRSGILSPTRKSSNLKRPTVPPPKPANVTVQRSVSARLANRPAVGPKPLASVKSVKRSESVKAAHYQNLASKATTCKNVVKGHMESSERDTARSLSIDSVRNEETFRNTLTNLGIETDLIHPEDYKALESAWRFFDYKDYQEQLHESPFHKLAEKIKQHHEKHLTEGNDQSETTKVERQQSYVSTESFYGSIDVTSLPATTPTGPSNSYDQSMADPAYDNFKGTVGQLCEYPRYDVVPNGMETSQESNNAEIIYAEVLDTGNVLTTPKTGMEKSVYEEIDIGLSSPYQELSNEIVKACRAEGHVVGASNFSNKSTRMSFLKTLLRKGKKETTVSAGKQDNTDPTFEDIVKDIENLQDFKLTARKAENTEGAPVDKQKAATLGYQYHKNSSIPSKKIVSPKEAHSQRPGARPPPPPTAATKTAEHRRMSQTLDHSANKHKMLLAKDKNGDFLPISHSGTSRKGSKGDIKGGYYDSPWTSPEHVISSILKQESTSKYIKSSTGKANGKHVALNLRMPDPKSATSKRNTLGHNRQSSMPSDVLESRHQSDTLRSGKLSPLSNATDSGYESATLSSVRKSGPPSDNSSTSRLSLPGSNNNSRPSSPQPRSTAIDSVPICLDQINAMNISTLQKLNKSFIDNVRLEEAPDVKWDELVIDNDEKPLHHNNKCAFYEAHIRDQPEKHFTLMISLRPPVEYKAYSPHLLIPLITLTVNVKPTLIPQQLLASYKSSSSPGSSPEVIQKSSSVTKDANSGPKSDEDSCYDKPWDNLLEKDSKILEESYKEGLLQTEKAKSLLSQNVEAYASFMPSFAKIESIQTYLSRREKECEKVEEFVMDSLYIVLQVLQLLFQLSERLLQIDTLSANDLCVTSDCDSLPTVTCHMLSVKKSTMDYSLTCEKLRMFLIQIVHLSEKLAKSSTFKKVEDLISNSSDQGDLKTIALIIQYLLWGPNNDEIKIMSVADSRKQAFDLWVQLARARLLNRLVMQKMDKLKIYMISNFLANTNGPELFKITKLLSTY